MESLLITLITIWIILGAMTYCMISEYGDYLDKTCHNIWSKIYVSIFFGGLIFVFNILREIFRALNKIK